MFKRIRSRFCLLVFAVSMMLSAEVYAAEYVLPNSNNRCIEYEEVSNYTYDMLQRGISEIYARHGYVFKTEVNRDYFGSKSWYIPQSWKTEDDVQAEFNAYEIYNVNYLLKLQGKSALPGTSTSRPASTQNNYVLPESSIRCIEDNEISSFSYDKLQTCISEIYARHGYVFAKQKNRDYFAAQSWYCPISGKTDKECEAEFNVFEIYNVNRLLHFQGIDPLPGTSTSRPAFEGYSAEYAESYGNGEDWTISGGSSIDGNYTGSAENGDAVEIVIRDGMVDIYLNGELSWSSDLEPLGSNCYQFSGSKVCFKFEKSSCTVYASDGRDAKIPFHGTYYK